MRLSVLGPLELGIRAGRDELLEAVVAALSPGNAP